MRDTVSTSNFQMINPTVRSISISMDKSTSCKILILTYRRIDFGFVIPGTAPVPIAATIATTTS